MNTVSYQITNISLFFVEQLLRGISRETCNSSFLAFLWGESAIGAE